MSGGQLDPIDVGRLLASPPDADRLEHQRIAAQAKARLLGTRSVVQLGRYALLRWLGAGAFGVVYAVRDPEMERDVAIKLLHASSDRALDRRPAILREARLQAQIVDPHVVEVFDVGWVDGRAFVVMRLVDGGDVETWWRERAPSNELVVDAIVQAGRGLAAAHRIGLVHRDVKPTNLLRTRDGVVKVADFGLAVAPSEGRGGGTPLYMAPEQRVGGRLDARADQFSLALVAIRLLTGELERPPKIGAAIARVLDRALQVDPERRFPTMDRFVDALERARRRRASRGPWWAGAAVVSTVLATGAALPERASGFRVQCAELDDEDLGARAFASWDAPTRDTLHSRFATDAQAARDLHHASVVIDRRVASWIDALRRTCASTPEPAALDCLALARGRTLRLVETLTHAEAMHLSSIVDAIAELAPPSSCTGATPTMDPLALAGMARIDEALAAMHDDRPAHAADVLADVLAGRVEYGDYVRAEAWYLRAKLDVRNGDDDLAATRFESAYHHAVAAEHWWIAVDSATNVAGWAAERQDRETAWRWLQDADALVVRSGEPLRLRAAWWNAAIGVHLARGDLEAAIAAAQTAVGMQRELGPSAKLVSALRAQAMTSLMAGRPTDAEPSIREALEVAVEIDAKHGELLDLMAGTLMELGRPDDALARQREAVAALTSEYGEDHPITHAPRLNLASLLRALDRRDEAIAVLRGVVDELDAADSPARVRPMARLELARALRETGALAEARRLAVRAIVELESRNDLRPTTLTEARDELAAIEAAL